MPRFNSTQLDLILRGLVTLEGGADLIEAQLIHELEEELAALIQQRPEEGSLRWWEALNYSTALICDRSHVHIIDQIKHILDGVEHALLICDPSQDDLPMVYVNQELCRLTGYTRRELLGRNPRVLQGSRQSQVGARLLQDAINDERPARVTFFNEHKDGSPLLVELRLSPLLNKRDEISCWVGLLDDVTARHQLQKELEEQRLLLEAVYNVAAVGICVNDDDGLYVEVNRAYCELYGYSRDELLGQDFTMVVPMAHREYARRSYLTYINGVDESKPAEWVVHRKDGSLVDIFVTSRRLVFTDGRRFIVTTIADITAQKAQAREREGMLLRQAQSQKLESIGALTAGVAHDLNNIFAGLIANLGALQALEQDRPATSEVLVEMEALMWRATDFLKTLAVSSGRQQQNLARVNLPDLVDELSRLFTSSPSTQELLIHHQSKALCARLDASQIHQVLSDLIINAFEASEEGGIVTMTTALRAVLGTDELEDLLTQSPVLPGLYAQICCMDRGEGIAPEHRAQIFDAFFSTKATGRGLGLATVAGGVRNHGGALLLESSPHHGAIFEVLLPLHLDLYDAPLKRRVLLVEDDPALLGALMRMLTVSGFEVFAATSAAEGLRHYLSAQGRVDLALIDVVLPKQRGDALAIELRRRAPTLPLLLMSGITRPVALLGDERCEFLLKPFDGSTLLQTMKMLGVTSEGVTSEGITS